MIEGLTVHTETTSLAKLKREYFWKKVVATCASSGVSPDLDPRYRHPRLRTAVRRIEHWSAMTDRGKLGHKVLVFGVYTSPLHDLVDLVNIRYALSSVDKGFPVLAPNLLFPSSYPGAVEQQIGCHAIDVLDGNLDRARAKMKLLAGLRVEGHWDTSINLARFQGAFVYLGAVSTGGNNSRCRSGAAMRTREHLCCASPGAALRPSGSLRAAHCWRLRIAAAPGKGPILHATSLPAAARRKVRNKLGLTLISGKTGEECVYRIVENDVSSKRKGRPGTRD